MLGLSRGQTIILIGTLILLVIMPFIIYFVNRYRQDIRSRADEGQGVREDEPQIPMGDFGPLTDFEPKEATAAPTPAPASGATTLRFTVQLEGRSAGNMAGEIFIGIAETQGNPPTYVLTGSNTADANGVVAGFTLSSLFPGRTYIVYLKGPQHIATSKSFVFQQGENTLGQDPILLLAGDLNADNVIDAFDSDLLEAAFGTTPSDAGWNPLADLNKDLIVNNIDLSLVAKNFGKQGAGGAWYSPTATPSASP